MARGTTKWSIEHNKLCACKVWKTRSYCPVWYRIRKSYFQEYHKKTYVPINTSPRTTCIICGEKLEQCKNKTKRSCSPVCAKKRRNITKIVWRARKREEKKASLEQKKKKKMVRS
jgi:hypothetical protein